MNRHAHILALMSIAFGAFGLSIGAEVRTSMIASGLLAVCAVATVLFERRAAQAPAVAAAATRPRGSNVQTKRLLMLLMVIGIVVYGGGAGTFATFSAETTNTNSSVASGTLTMTDSVNSATACASTNSQTQDNVNEVASGQTIGGNPTSVSGGAGNLGACDIALTLSNLAPGVFAGFTKLAIANTGSLDASKFWLFAPNVNATISTQAASGATSITVTPLEGPVKSGDTIEFDYGGTSWTTTAAAAVNPLGTTITLSAATTQIWPAGTRILDTSTDGKDISNNPQNTDCFDIRNGTTTVSGSTVGTDLNFNKTGEQTLGGVHWVTDSTSTYTGPLCAKMGFWIQEQSVVNGSTYNYCWYGDGAANTSHPSTNGQCRAPLSAAMPGNQNIDGSTTYNITPASTLKGNVTTGDQIIISQLSKPSAYCTATADSYIGGTTISFNSCKDAATSGNPISTVTPYSFTNAATITDGTTLTYLNSDTQTLANFDTLDGPKNKQELVSLVGNGKIATTGATVNSVELGKHGAVGSADSVNFIGSSPDTRTFYLGVFLPSGTNSQNTLQGLKSTFGIGWHIDQ